MDFITGALPNVMFIAGLIAIGIGLGIEFKIVEIKGELSKQGRIGAIGIGAVLVLISIYLYTRPPQTAGAPTTAAGAPSALVQANAGGAGLALPQAPAQATSVAATAVAPSATVVPPTATAAPPRAASAPTKPPAPTATPMPPTRPPAPAAAPGVTVPDIRGQSLKDAKKTIESAGLRLGAIRESCADIGASDDGRKLKKGQVRCQSPAPGSVAAPNTTVMFVLAGGGQGRDD